MQGHARQRSGKAARSYENEPVGRLVTGRGNAGAHLPRLLELIADGAIRPERVASEVIAWETAPEALSGPSLKPIFVRD